MYGFVLKSIRQADYNPYSIPAYVFSIKLNELK